MRIALHAPAPEAGGPAWLKTLGPPLERAAQLVRIVEAGAPPTEADLDLYVIASDPRYAFVYETALARPGVVVLHDWSIHGLVARATLEAGHTPAYLREMRRAHGEAGTFVGRQVAQGLGGRLFPSLFPVNHRLLEGSLGVVAATADIGRRAERRLPGRPVLTLPLDLLGPSLRLPERAEARRALGLPGESVVVAVDVADPATARLTSVFAALGRLKKDRPALRVLALSSPDERARLFGPAFDAGTADLALGLAAADIVVALRFPAQGGVPPLVVGAVEHGRPVLVTAGTSPAEELPEGVVVRVDPDATEEAQVESQLDYLLASPTVVAQIGAAEREHLASVYDPAAAAQRLVAFLREVLSTKDAALRALAAERADDHTLLGYAIEEVRWGARDLGLLHASLGLEPLLAGLLAPRESGPGEEGRG